MSISVLVCGSRNFDDKMFVYGMLDTLREQIGIHTVYTSKYAGACELASQWVKEINEFLPKEKKITLKECNFDSLLAEKSSDFYDKKLYTIDLELLMHDEFYTRGAEKMAQMEVNAVLPFPNQLGEIGPHTSNIMRFAQIAKLTQKVDIPVLDATPSVYAAIKTNRAAEAALEANDKALQHEGLKNSHPGKKM